MLLKKLYPGSPPVFFFPRCPHSDQWAPSNRPYTLYSSYYRHTVTPLCCLNTSSTPPRKQHYYNRLFFFFKWREVEKPPVSLTQPQARQWCRLLVRALKGSRHFIHTVTSLSLIQRGARLPSSPSCNKRDTREGNFLNFKTLNSASETVFGSLYWQKKKCASPSVIGIYVDYDNTAGKREQNPLMFSHIWSIFLWHCERKIKYK